MSLSSGYHPQSNGQAERLNQERGSLAHTAVENNTAGVNSSPRLNMLKIL